MEKNVGEAVKMAVQPFRCEETFLSSQPRKPGDRGNGHEAQVRKRK